MNLPFHYTSENDWYLLWFMGGAVVLVLGGLLINLSRGKLTTASGKSGFALLRWILGVALLGAGIFTMAMQFLGVLNARDSENAAAEKVNSYNVQLLKHKVDERYDLQLTTKQTQQLLDNYVYGGNSPDTRNYHNVLVEVAGAQTKVKLVQQGQRWYLYSTSQELLPVR